MEVKVWLTNHGQVTKGDARITYQEDRFFCIEKKDGTVVKWPIDHIYRVEET